MLLNRKCIPIYINDNTSLINANRLVRNRYRREWNNDTMENDGENLTIIFDFWTLQDKYHIGILSVRPQLTCTIVARVFTDNSNKHTGRIQDLKLGGART
jgi:hypothetical protein